jgi:hypothetical protein
LKKAFVAALLTSAAVATLAVPAGAAVPKTKPTATIICDDAGNTAQVWFTAKRTAVDAGNCTDWVGLVSGDALLAVAPGAHFHRRTNWEGANFVRISPSTMCNGDWDYAVVVRPGRHGRFEVPACRS